MEQSSVAATPTIVHPHPKLIQQVILAIHLTKLGLGLSDNYVGDKIHRCWFLLVYIFFLLDISHQSNTLHMWKTFYTSSTANHAFLHVCLKEITCLCMQPCLAYSECISTGEFCACNHQNE